MAFKGKPILLERLLSLCCGQPLNPNWHEGRHFPPPVLFGPDFVSWIFTKNFQTFLEVKIDINRVNLTPCQAHRGLKNMLLGGTEDEHFSYFHRSCQLGFKPWFLIRFLAPLSRLWLRLALSLCMLQKCVAALGCSAYYVVCRLPFRSMNK